MSSNGRESTEPGGTPRPLHFARVYQLLLTRKYLLSKIMPLLAAIAVLLCTGTVMLVWSVMGGFLETLLRDGRAIQGDIKISWPIAGFAHYEDLIAELEKRPEIEAAAPVVETLGVLRLPDSRIKTVSVVGIDGPRYAKVTSYEDCLWWRPITPEQQNPKDYEGDDHRLGQPARRGAIAAVVTGLAAAGLGRHIDRVARALDQADGGEAHRRPEQIDQTGDEQRDAATMDGGHDGDPVRLGGAWVWPSVGASIATHGHVACRLLGTPRAAQPDVRRPAMRHPRDLEPAVAPVATPSRGDGRTNPASR